MNNKLKVLKIKKYYTLIKENFIINYKVIQILKKNVVKLIHIKIGIKFLVFVKD